MIYTSIDYISDIFDIWYTDRHWWTTYLIHQRRWMVRISGFDPFFFRNAGRVPSCAPSIAELQPNASSNRWLVRPEKSAKQDVDRRQLRWIYLNSCIVPLTCIHIICTNSYISIYIDIHMIIYVWLWNISIFTDGSGFKMF